MGTVVQRLRTQVKNGLIRHVERPATYERAEEIFGRRLDRRKNYAIIKGEVCDLATWSRCCSGCCDGHEAGCIGPSCRGGGCEECGHTGRRREAYWMPISPKDTFKNKGRKS
jgi:hypothetical protein